MCLQGAALIGRYELGLTGWGWVVFFCCVLCAGAVSGIQHRSHASHLTFCPRLSLCVRACVWCLPVQASMWWSRTNVCVTRGHVADAVQLGQGGVGDASEARQHAVMLHAQQVALSNAVCPPLHVAGCL